MSSTMNELTENFVKLCITSHKDIEKIEIMSAREGSQADSSKKIGE